MYLHAPGGSLGWRLRLYFLSSNSKRKHFHLPLFFLLSVFFSFFSSFFFPQDSLTVQSFLSRPCLPLCWPRGWGGVSEEWKIGLNACTTMLPPPSIIIGHRPESQTCLNLILQDSVFSDFLHLLYSCSAVAELAFWERAWLFFFPSINFSFRYQSIFTSFLANFSLLNYKK